MTPGCLEKSRSPTGSAAHRVRGLMAITATGPGECGI